MELFFLESGIISKDSHSSFFRNSSLSIILSLFWMSNKYLLIMKCLSKCSVKDFCKLNLVPQEVHLNWRSSYRELMTNSCFLKKNLFQYNLT